MAKEESSLERIPMVWLDRLLLRYVIHGSQQPSQQELGIKMGLPRKDLWKTFFCDALDPHEIAQKTSKVFQQKYCHPGLHKLGNIKPKDKAMGTEDILTLQIQVSSYRLLLSGLAA